MFSAQLVIFDLDGTLIDSVPDIAAAVNNAWAAQGWASVSEAQVSAWVGKGPELLIAQALAACGVEAARQDEMFALFMQHYASGGHAQSRLYDSVAGMLASLQARGLRLAICTNKPARFVEPVLAKLGVAHYFELIIGGDSLPTRKPDPGPLVHIAQALTIPVAQCLMVGDSVNDVDAARAAGMAVVAVSYGYNHGVDIREAQPDRVLDSLAELPALISLA